MIKSFKGILMQRLDKVKTDRINMKASILEKWRYLKKLKEMLMFDLIPIVTSIH